MRLTEAQVQFLEHRWKQSRQEIAHLLREKMQVQLVIVAPNEEHDFFNDALEANFTN